MVWQLVKIYVLSQENTTQQLRLVIFNMGIHCHDMKKGQIFTCEECGLELKVVAECEECGTPQGGCACEAPCTYECCGKPLALKK